MNKKIKLRLTGLQHAVLYKHLFPGDQNESVAMALCGFSNLQTQNGIELVLSVFKIIPIPNEDCIERTGTKVKWKTDLLPDLLREASIKKMVLLKIHSHPNIKSSFSRFDDESDIELFRSIAGWLDNDLPGISAIMYSDKRIIARAVSDKGEFSEVDLVTVAGADIKFWHFEDNNNHYIPEYCMRTAQAFGSGTTECLSKLTIGVVGASGTGSSVIEMLYRLGVGKLVIIDPDLIEEKNLNRIYNSSMENAKNGDSKVDVLAEAIIRSGLPTEVEPFKKNIFDKEMVNRLAHCDILFGCVDSIDGRDLLNRIAVYYSIPYFDIGVKIEADGSGNINYACGTVHYLHPDGSSLYSRKVYSTEDLRASSLFRTNPEAYRDQVREKYIKGVNEDRPAVISVNTLISSLAINDFLARIHIFRDEPNENIGSLCISLNQSRIIVEEEGLPCSVLAKYAGRGDVLPLLNMHVFS